jgi:hypothetical protein
VPLPELSQLASLRQASFLQPLVDLLNLYEVGNGVY